MSPSTEPLDVLWSLWAELGVPGIVHEHGNVSIDPEPLLVYTPYLAHKDPRLMEMVWAWCAGHHAALGTARVRRLHGAVADSVAAAFEEFVGALKTVVDVRWPASGPPALTLNANDLRPLGLPVHRPALAWFRARAAMGIGSRSDLLCVFLSAREHQELRAAELVRYGYSRRVIDDVLTSWADSGLLRAREVSGTSHYTLARPDSWRAALEAENLRWLDSLALLEFLACFVELRALQDEPDIVRRVGASKMRARIAPLASRKRLSLPVVDGRPDGFERMIDVLDVAWRGEDPSQNAPDLTRPVAEAADR